MDRPAVCDRDAAGFFGNDQNDRIRNFAHADRGPVTRTVGFGNVALRYGEDAFGCDDAVAFDDDGAVVQRCVLEEDIFEKRRREFGIDGDTAFGDEPQVALAADHDERTRFVGGHLPAGLDDRCDDRYRGIVVSVEDAGDEVEPFLAHADHLQKPPDFRLEDDDKGDDADADELPQDVGEQLHVERAYDNPHQVDHDDPGDDVGGVCSPGSAVDPEHDRRYQDDIYEIDECERNKSHGVFR